MKRPIALFVSSALSSLLIALGACGGDEETTPPTGSGCTPTSTDCPALEIGGDCLALTDNTGLERFALRLSQLTITAPEQLTTAVVYNIIADGVNINLPECNVAGMGTFSMIAEFDKGTGTLKIGGAFPEANPADGYCFIDDPTHEVAPVEIASNLNADGTFETDTIDRIVVPIYVDATGDQIVYLPLREGRFLSGTVSADQNCVGSFNDEGLLPEFNCAPDPGAGIEYFHNGAELEGYITLEDADAVDVELIDASLCVLLSGDPGAWGDGGMPIERCRRDMATNAIELQGDWCSTTNSAGGCRDALKVLAGLAASATTVRDNCP